MRGSPPLSLWLLWLWLVVGKLPRQPLPGTVLVAGSVQGFAPRAELYDPRTGTWATTADMVEFREHHTATLLPDGTVFGPLGIKSPLLCRFELQARVVETPSEIRRVDDSLGIRLEGRLSGGQNR